MVPRRPEQAAGRRAGGRPATKTRRRPWPPRAAESRQERPAAGGRLRRNLGQPQKRCRPRPCRLQPAPASGWRPAGQPVLPAGRLRPPTRLQHLVLDPATGQVKNHDRYTDKSFKAQLLQSVYALHVGEYFGLLGRIIVTLASLTMPLFFVTGWLLYLDRRRKKRQVREARGNVASNDGSGESWLIGFASQSGFAEQLAWQSAGQLQAAGMPVQVRALAELGENDLRQARRALFVISTFGDGEAPDSARAFERKVLGQPWALNNLSYAVLALGDRQYPHFCRLRPPLAGMAG
ncbi:flavodoxin domain-containing protein [Pseudomonas sp. PhalM4]